MSEIPLSRSEIDTLIALHLVAPATVVLIDVTRNVRWGSHGPLKSLTGKGLVSREKAPAPPALTKEEIYHGARLRLGKRPHLYELTGSGRTVAHHLAAIRNELSQVN